MSIFQTIQKITIISQIMFGTFYENNFRNLMKSLGAIWLAPNFRHYYNSALNSKAHHLLNIDLFISYTATSLP